MPETESIPSKSKGFKLLLLKVATFLIAVYLVQWFAELAFEPSDSDELGKLLKPFQNHYLSFSQYYLTSEGSASEFTNDSTAAGRMIEFLLLGGLVLGIVMLPLNFIKSLSRYLQIISYSLVVILVGVAFYAGFIAPPRKATLSENLILFEKTNWVVFKHKGQLSYRDIEKFEFDYASSRSNEFGNALWAQIYAVAGGKRYLLGENQVPQERTDSIRLSPGQKQALQRTVDALTKWIQKK